MGTRGADSSQKVQLLGADCVPTEGRVPTQLEPVWRGQ